ncbi:MAG: hypothetical protein KA139_10275 [Rhodobacteraceae bacterium]|nr:hypothetical protein [Paracoccaceae bacterium]
MRAAAALALLVLLPACVAGEAVIQETTRGLARNAVDAAAGRYLPGGPVKPFTDCIVNNATTDELLKLAGAAGAGDAQAAATRAWPVVQGVAARPDTRMCLVQAMSSGDVLLRAQGLAVGELE